MYPKTLALYRNNDINADIYQPASQYNPGGGTISKVTHLGRAMPKIAISNNIQDCHYCIAEMLWFTEAGDGQKTNERIEAYASLDAMKILWTSDVELLRVPGYMRQRLIDSSDVIGCLSEYAYQLFSAYTSKVEMLYDPIDIDEFIPAAKRREIYGIGQISVQKNVKMIAEIFSKLPICTNLEKTYIGSKNTWGGNPNLDVGIKLESLLDQSTDHFERHVPYSMMSKRIAPIWGYVADTGYDFSSYSMLEAMLVGCWLFTGKHLMYNERPGFRFETSDEAVAHIVNQLQENPPESGRINEEARQFVIDRNSYDAFRGQLKHLIGKSAIGV